MRVALVLVDRHGARHVLPYGMVLDVPQPKALTDAGTVLRDPLKLAVSDVRYAEVVDLDADDRVQVAAAERYDPATAPIPF